MYVVCEILSWKTRCNIHSNLLITCRPYQFLMKFLFRGFPLSNFKDKEKKRKGKRNERKRDEEIINTHPCYYIYIAGYFWFIERFSWATLRSMRLTRIAALTAINDRTHPRFHVCRNDHFFFFFFFSISSRVSCRVISPFYNAFPSLPRSCYATHNSFFFLSRSRCTRLLHLLSSHVCTSCTHCP